VCSPASIHPSESYSVCLLKLMIQLEMSNEDYCYSYYHAGIDPLSVQVILIIYHPNHLCHLSSSAVVIVVVAAVSVLQIAALIQTILAYCQYLHCPVLSYESLFIPLSLIRLLHSHHHHHLRHKLAGCWDYLHYD